METMVSDANGAEQKPLSDPSLLFPPPPPPASSSSSSAAAAISSASIAFSIDPPHTGSKRRWSPCTWRYATEELQPLDMGSRSRSSSIVRKKPSDPEYGRHRRDRHHRTAKRYAYYSPCGGDGSGGEFEEEGEAMEARVWRKAKVKEQEEENGGRQMSGQVWTRREPSPSELYFCHVCTEDHCIP